MKPFLPRYIRLRDVTTYLGVNINYFNRYIRPFLVDIPLGDTKGSGIAFDRLDLDAWADHYKQRKGRPGIRRGELWQKEKSQDCKNVATRGISTKRYTESDFAKVVEQIILKKRRNI